ncbi:MAG: dihydropteroate synthase [Synergistaceae bacterium]|nr:dihydropteroate synthase [Synergistaceae bacterium]
MHLAGGRSLLFGRTLVMGILNMTPDSFFAPSRLSSPDDALETARKMARDGADILDIGAESTRPGSQAVLEDSEIAALIPAIEAIRDEMPQIPISVDTRRAKTARLSLKAGADIINDVSGLELPCESQEMVSLLCETGASYVLMHTKGTPDVMQQNPHYDDFWADLFNFFEAKIESLLRAGVSRDRIILDPGVGFGKRMEDNIEIVANIGEMRKFGLPVLAGVSRKGFLGRIIHLAGLESQATPENSLEGTLAVSALCAEEGVQIIRVHDVKENRRVVETVSRIKEFRHE